jgi:7-cyano-7-deazaguanine synthase
LELGDVEEKAVIICSGGLDSTTLLYDIANTFWEVYPINFSYGQKHNKETEYLKYHISRLGLQDRIKYIELTALASVAKSSLLNPELDIPNISDPTQRTHEVIKQTVVPFRNAVFLSVAVSYAISINANSIFYGAHASDYANYPDTRPEFVNAFNKAVWEGTQIDIEIQAPYIFKKKKDVLKRALKLKVPVHKTWSCYRGLEIHCGNCPSCIERKQAFSELKVNDPTIYI